MPQTVIDNPILNSPYREPTRHFRFDANNEITNIIDAGRRSSSYFLPIAAPKKKTAPGLFDSLEEKKEESGHVNRIRQLVKGWRDHDWPDITPVTRALLEHWAQDPNLINRKARPWKHSVCRTGVLKALCRIVAVIRP